MVSFYPNDKKRKATSIKCSVQPTNMGRIIFTVSNSFIDPKEWARGRLKTGKGKHDNGRLQDRLDNLKRLIQDFYEIYFDNHKKYPTKVIFINFLKSNKSVKDYFQKNDKAVIVDLFNRIITRRTNGQELTKGHRFSSQSLSLFNSTLKAIKGFQEYKGQKHLYIEDFKSKQLIEEFEIYLTIELDMMINTIANKMKTLKSFLQIALSEGLIEYNPFRQHGIVIYTEETDAVVFTRDELIALENLDLSFNPDYERIRDQYLIYLWSGIRKSDLKNLLAVINPHTDKFIFRSGKTGEICEIPAFETLRRLAEKYDYNFPEPIHDTIVLSEIKKICKMIPSMDIVVEKNYTKGGSKKRDLVKKYQRIVIHTGRRTLATLLVEYGLPYEQVMKITGHKKLLTLQRYIKSSVDTDLMLSIGNKIKNG